jgi:hypothetical protein
MSPVERSVKGARSGLTRAAEQQDPKLRTMFEVARVLAGGYDLGTLLPRLLARRFCPLRSLCSLRYNTLDTAS